MASRSHDPSPDLRQVYRQVLASHGVAPRKPVVDTAGYNSSTAVGSQLENTILGLHTPSVRTSFIPHTVATTNTMVYGPGERAEGESYLAHAGATGGPHLGPNLETGQSQAVVSAMRSLKNKVRLLEEQRDRERAAAESMRRTAGEAVIDAREQVEACRRELEQSELKIIKEREELVQLREQLFQETQMMSAEIEAKRQELTSSRQDIQYLKEHIERTSAASSDLTSRVQTTFIELNHLNDDSSERVTAVAAAQEQLQADLERTEISIKQIQSAIEQEKRTRDTVIAERETAEATLERLVKLNNDLMKKVGQIAAYIDQPPTMIVHERPPKLGKKKKKKENTQSTDSHNGYDRPMWHL